MRRPSGSRPASTTCAIKVFSIATAVSPYLHQYSNAPSFESKCRTGENLGGDAGAFLNLSSHLNTRDLQWRRVRQVGAIVDRYSCTRAAVCGSVQAVDIETQYALGTLASLGLLWAWNAGLGDIATTIARTFQPYYDGKHDHERHPQLVRALRRRRMLWCAIIVWVNFHLSHDRGVYLWVRDVGRLSAALAFIYFFVACYEFWTEYRQAKQQRTTFGSGLL